MNRSIRSTKARSCSEIIVKDDSGSHAVFTEQGSSASQLTAAKAMKVIARLPDCAGRSSRRSISLHSNNNGRRSKIAQHSKVRMSRFMDTSSDDHNFKEEELENCPKCPLKLS